MLLALERSAAVASAAVLSDDGRILGSAAEPAGGQGDALPVFREALAAAGASPADLTAFAVGVGPGSFSGVRSALALAFGLALPAGIPVRGVSSAAAAVRAWRSAHPAARPLRLLGDARRGHVWCFDEPADFRALAHTAADLRLFAARPDAEDGLPPLSEALAGDRDLLVADPARLAPLLDGVAFAPAAPSAEDVAALFLEGCFGPPDPVYVHPAVVGRTVSEV